jgi:hypothetical protein
MDVPAESNEHLGFAMIVNAHAWKWTTGHGGRDRTDDLLNGMHSAESGVRIHFFDLRTNRVSRSAADQVRRTLSIARIRRVGGQAGKCRDGLMPSTPAPQMIWARGCAELRRRTSYVHRDQGRCRACSCTALLSAQRQTRRDPRRWRR